MVQHGLSLIVSHAKYQSASLLPGYKSSTIDVDPCKYNGYLSYQYVGKLFAEDLCDAAFQWETIGVANAKHENSAFWLGTPGAQTRCHYDSYGVNVVVQLHGTKRWVLFPPQDSPYLYPTRLPFEESTVRSAINDPLRPDLDTYPKATLATPQIVVLNAGDVLFVPHHWWHAVDCTSVAVSVNAWLPHANDRHEQLKEALARLITSSLSSSLDDKGQSAVVCATEERTTPHEVLGCMEAAGMCQHPTSLVQDMLEVLLQDSSKSDRICLHSMQVYKLTTIEVNQNCFASLPRKY
eukprot:m.138091 g.138091  ORF g.138091 m.138091 type:complete len:294 (-) comp14008_c0_seq6:333-1214(-)